MRKEKCFVICPIGDDGSEVRKTSDRVMRHILKPVLDELGYDPIRADQMPSPGVITNQVIEAILQFPLVIADLSGGNPNVFYELALRHASRKPYVQLISADERVPFDVFAVRTIRYDLTDPDSLETAKVTLRRQVEEIHAGHVVDSPISTAFTSTLFQGNENAVQLFLEKFWQIESDFESMQQGMDKLLTRVDSIKEDISDVESRLSSIESDVSAIEDDVGEIKTNLD